MDHARIEWCSSEASDVVHALTQEAFAPQAALDPPSGALRETVEVVRHDLASGRGVLAHVDDRPVAAARVLLRPDHLHVRRVAVRPDLQRRGVASSVMRWLHAQAVVLGYQEVRLGVRTALPSNQELYRSLGYESVADHGYWIEMRRRIVMADLG